MEVVLKFNLPEEKAEFEIAQKGGRYLSCMEDFSNNLRAKYKYQDKQETTWEEVRQLWYDTLEDNDVELFTY